MKGKSTNTTKTRTTMSNTNLSMLIDFYIGDMQRRGCSSDAMITNKRALQRFARFLAPQGEEIRLTMITPERATGYLDDLQTRETKWGNHPNHPTELTKLSPFTVIREVKILRGFGTWLEREGFDNPFSGLPIPKAPRYIVDILTDSEIAKLVEGINPDTEIGARQYALVMLMLDSGLRISEVANARLENLDMERRVLKVKGKGNKERIVPFGQRAAQALMRYLHLHRPTPLKKEDTFIFLAGDGVPMTRNSLEQVVRRLRLNSGIKRLHAHLFRHTFAVKFLESGGDLRTLQLILGHASLIVTQKYLHLSDMRIQAQYEANSPMDRLNLPGQRRYGSRRKRPDSESDSASTLG